MYTVQTQRTDSSLGLQIIKSNCHVSVHPVSDLYSAAGCRCQAFIRQQSPTRFRRRPLSQRRYWRTCQLLCNWLTVSHCYRVLQQHSALRYNGSTNSVVISCFSVFTVTECWTGNSSPLHGKVATLNSCYWFISVQLVIMYMLCEACMWAKVESVASGW